MTSDARRGVRAAGLERRSIAPCLAPGRRRCRASSARARSRHRRLVAAVRHPAPVAALDAQRLDETPEAGAVADARGCRPWRGRRAASSSRISVERPIPLGAVTSAVESPAAQAEACSGARPRVPAHQSAGYCISSRSREQVEPRPQDAGGCPVARGRTPAVRELGAVAACSAGAGRSPPCRRSRATTSPSRRQAPRVRSSQPSRRRTARRSASTCDAHRGVAGLRVVQSSPAAPSAIELAHPAERAVDRERSPAVSTGGRSSALPPWSGSRRSGRRSRSVRQFLAQDVGDGTARRCACGRPRPCAPRRPGGRACSASARRATSGPRVARRVPVFPAMTISGTELTAVATTGMPQVIASTTEHGQPLPAGSTCAKTSNAGSSAGRPRGRRAAGTVARVPSSRSSRSVLARRSPSPIQTM